MGETEADRILPAWITGTAARYARGRPLTDAEEAKALASLIEVAAEALTCRPKSRAWRSASPKEPRVSLGSSKLLIKAGADEELIPRWIEEGCRRAKNRKAQGQDPLGKVKVPGQEGSRSPGCTHTVRAARLPDLLVTMPGIYHRQSEERRWAISAYAAARACPGVVSPPCAGTRLGLVGCRTVATMGNARRVG
jgi:hypothetical protein